MTVARTVKKVAAAGLGAVAIAAGLPAGTGEADVLCYLTTTSYVRDYPSAYGAVLYTIPAGYAFRWTGGYSPDYQWAHGNGNGGAIGWIPNDGRLRC